MPFEATLDAFARALADPARPAPLETLGREGRPDARRFAVYRNNVAAALIGALEARFPVVRRLTGDGFFRAMAGAFVAAEKPATAKLIDYGGGFPAFVARFPPAREIAYLADVARLENAWVEAYHAADAPTLDLAALGGVEPADLARLRFAPHPAARLMRFGCPAASIWAAHQGGGEPRPPEVWRNEDALIARPDAEVVVRVLPPGGFAFASALFSGASLAEAAEARAEENVDPGAHLVGLIEAGAFSSVE
jgi:hypothetical protein